MKNMISVAVGILGRNRLWLTLFAVSFLFSGCKDINVSWVYYDETQCADRWERSNNNEAQKDLIIDYFKQKGIKIYELEIFADGTPEACTACTCKTGRRIKSKVKNKQVDDMKAEGFYE